MLDRVSVALPRSGFSLGAMTASVRASEPATFPMDTVRPARVNDETLMPSGPTVPNGMPLRTPVSRKLDTLALARWAATAGSAIPVESRTLPSIASNARVRRVVLDMATSLLLAPSNHDDRTRVAAQNTEDRETGQSEATR